MEFDGVWLNNSDIEKARRDRFAKELITFRDGYEKPVIDAFKEVTKIYILCYCYLHT